MCECVGTDASIALAVSTARPGGSVGFVGVPHLHSSFDVAKPFADNIALRFGVAPVRAYIPELLESVLSGEIDPSPVFDLTVDMDGVPEGYAAMHERRAVKALIKP